MPKSKKNNAFLHPLDTIAQWYAEAQTIPTQLRKSFEGEKEKTLHHIKKMTNELNHAKTLQRKAKALQVTAIKKLKEKSTKTSRDLVKKCKSEYQNTLQKTEKLASEVNAAKNQLKYAKLKQKYFNALENAFLSVTKIFTKKHEKNTAKKAKSRTHKRRVKKSTAKTK